MIIKRELPIDVVEASKQRIIDIFNNAPKVYLSISGGKDSAIINHLTYRLIIEKKIDKSKLTVVFIDEEAIYPDVEKIVLRQRDEWLRIGVNFDWYAMEYKHFNCFNSLTEDESFVCFDRYKKDVWVRKPPEFAIRSDKFLVPRKDSYQSWSAKKFNDGVIIIGLRTAESIQRLIAISKSVGISNKKYPIFDWRDNDVWLYLKNNKVDFPITYLYLYQVGNKKNNMRLSQFFSIDTAVSLVSMNQYYPELMEKIIKREPNAYLAAYYFDSSMFRRSSAKRKELENKDIDYKKLVLEKLSDIKLNFPTKDQQKIAEVYKMFVVTLLPKHGNKTYKTIYDALEAGDPKQRTFRSVMMSPVAKD